GGLVEWETGGDRQDAARVAVQAAISDCARCRRSDDEIQRLIGARPSAVPCRVLGQRYDAVWAAAIAAVVVAFWGTCGHRCLDKLPGGRQDRIAHRDTERACGVVRGGIDDDVVVRREALALAEVG